MEELLGTTTLDDEGSTELELGKTELLLGTATLDDDGSAELELGTEEELGSWQVGTICAEPAFTSSIQAKSDICEQVPAFNLQETSCCSWLDDKGTAELELGATEELLGSSTELLLGSSGGGLDGESPEQAKNVNAMAKIVASGKNGWFFIITSYG